MAPEPMYLACSWVINQRGLDKLTDIADAAEALDLGMVVRQTFTDPNSGKVIYPFAVRIVEEEQIHAFVLRIGAEVGMDDWYIVNEPYYRAGLDFVGNVRSALRQMPNWLPSMRAFAERNQA